MQEKEDQVIDTLGDIGKWQWMVIVLIGTYVGVTNAWADLVISFLTPTVDYFCVPQSTTDRSSKSFAEWNYLLKDQLIAENISISKCTVMNYTSTGHLIETNVTCNSWVYDTSFYPRTTITQFDLVCSRDYLVTLTQSLFMFGILLGAFFSGALSDKTGRKYSLAISAAGFSIFGIGTAFSTSMEIFNGLRFFAGFFAIGIYNSGFCYCMELVGGRYVVIVGIGLAFPWALGYLSLTGLSFAIREWSHLQLAISVPVMPFIVIALLLPESPKWLLTEGRLDEAKEVMQRALKFNGKEWPVGKRLVKVAGTETSSNYLDLLRHPNLRKKTLIQWYLWFTCSLVYFGMTLNTGTLIPGGNLYVDYGVQAAIEFPAYAFSMVVLLYVGRRLPLSAMMLICGMALLLMLAVPAGLPAQALSTIGKFGVASSFTIIYLYAAELFPTVVRNSGLGSCTIAATVGSMVSPLIGRELGKVSVAFPLGIFGACSLLAGMLALCLPETHGRMLPDSIEEGELADSIK